MSKDKDKDEDRATKYHNEGQEDGAKGPGNYDPPHGWLWNTTVGSDEDRKDSESYREGYRNAINQR